MYNVHTHVGSHGSLRRGSPPPLLFPSNAPTIYAFKRGRVEGGEGEGTGEKKSKRSRAKFDARRGREYYFRDVRIRARASRRGHPGERRTDFTRDKSVVFAHAAQFARKPERGGRERACVATNKYLTTRLRNRPPRSPLAAIPLPPPSHPRARSYRVF